MRIEGRWLRWDDGVTRPIVRAEIIGADAAPRTARFLVDTGSDRTVFSAALTEDLQLPHSTPDRDHALVGISGPSPFVLVATALEFRAADGGAARVRGEFAAFTDPHATDLSVLGRDVLDNFDLIVSRRRDEILLLAPAHRYRVERA